MSSITTAGRWIDLPSAGGGASPWRQDAPFSSGLAQIAASNATLAARENSLRTLYEHPGSDSVQASLDWDSIDGFPWDRDPADAAGAPLILFAGVHRVRQYGETAQYPPMVLRARLAAPATYTAGIILVARRDMGRPSSSDAQGHVTTSSTTLTTVSISLDVSSVLGERAIAPRIGSAIPAPPPPEVGAESVVALYVGVYRTGGAGAWKATVAGITIYQAAP